MYPLVSAACMCSGVSTTRLSMSVAPVHTGNKCKWLSAHPLHHQCVYTHTCVCVCSGLDEHHFVVGVCVCVRGTQCLFRCGSVGAKCIIRSTCLLWGIPLHWTFGCRQGTPAGPFVHSGASIPLVWRFCGTGRSCDGLVHQSVKTWLLSGAWEWCVCMSLVCECWVCFQVCGKYQVVLGNTARLALFLVLCTYASWITRM